MNARDELWGQGPRISMIGLCIMFLEGSKALAYSHIFLDVFLHFFIFPDCAWRKFFSMFFKSQSTHLSSQASYKAL